MQSTGCLSRFYLLNDDTTPQRAWIDLFGVGGLFPILDHVMTLLSIRAFKFSSSRVYMNLDVAVMGKQTSQA